MKKFLCFAAAALTLFAACQKTTVVYDNDEPQEIAVFAVNKAATKAPVSGTIFPNDYDMQVAAYLASGGLDTDAQSGDYFNGTLFKKGSDDESMWTGGKYWPMSMATLNFLAIAMPPAEQSPYTGSVSSVTFGENSASFVKQAVVVFANNQTVETDDAGGTTANYNQFDLMYAAGNQSHSEGSGYNNVSMTFKHALSWIKFTVATNLKNTSEEDNTFAMTVNSIRLSGASYGGTLTVATTKTLTENLTTTDYTPVWSSLSNSVDNVYVPDAPAQNDGTVAKAMAVSGLSDYDATATSFGNGLLVVPYDYSQAQDGTRPKITINYTMSQGNGLYTFERTVEIPAIEWNHNKIYTYALNINLTEISVQPSVTEWEDYDNDSSTNDVKDPINVEADSVSDNGAGA